MTTMTATTAKSKFLGLLRKSHDVGEVFSVTRNGAPYAVIMGQEEYDGLLETIEILQDKVFARDLISRVQKSDKRGGALSFEKVAGRPQQK